ncbi:hypothetical protein NZD85_04930 [Empedobacter stercoris]|uniref:hypothetical protein n=2 Tax=Weeksellaceae TaxID=2762318 RepID=UPI001C8E573C|nr:MULTISPECIES: hypothetical protein [Empedobacter]MBY0067556.1 hypothetical protein [Empedobacter falsenii]MCA4781479.1 hypothetical protein [Empedobacter stercoris]MDM1542003.1 hypothetical protein [Empedobacter sp. 189-2]UWX67951.1 hypothetical protein NZD85_04930 [Empedobacter stercoris]
MYLHKEQLDELFRFLPTRYRKEVCKRMKIKYTDANKQKVWRVKTGETTDNKMLECLIKLAKENQTLYKKNKQLLEAE